ncbi:MAG: hypothetical protein CMI60_12495 [Parvibaculum sp.]|nr:hypothetical protein [Parvibaculum sp.]
MVALLFSSLDNSEMASDTDDDTEPWTLRPPLICQLPQLPVELLTSKLAVAGVGLANAHKLPPASPLELDDGSTLLTSVRDSEFHVMPEHVSAAVVATKQSKRVVPEVTVCERSFVAGFSAELVTLELTEFGKLIAITASSREHETHQRRKQTASHSPEREDCD